MQTFCDSIITLFKYLSIQNCRQTNCGQICNKNQGKLNINPDKIALGLSPETLGETIESDPLCITDLFQNKSVAYF